MVDDGSDDAWLGGVDVVAEVVSRILQEGSDGRSVSEGCTTRDDAVGAVLVGHVGSRCLRLLLGVALPHFWCSFFIFSVSNGASVKGTMISILRP